MKEAVIKIYNTSGAITGVYYDFNISTFDSFLNGGLGDAQVTLARGLDDIDYGITIQEGYELQYIIYDNDNPTGITMYSGEINNISINVGQSEYVVIDCYGYAYQLSANLLEATGSQTYIKYSAQDPSAIIRNILDKHDTTFGATNQIAYTTATIPTTGKSVTIDFYSENVMNAINIVARTADADWNWRIGSDNLFYFNEISTTPNHYFVMGKDISYLQASYTSRDLKNTVLFSNELTVEDPEYIYKLYQNTASATTFGRRVEFMSDNRFRRSTGSADERANRFINTFKNPIDSINIRILDNNLTIGYDIESVYVGDTFKILNIDSTFPFSDNYLITQITYQPNYIDIVASDVVSYVERSIEAQKNIIRNSQWSDNLPKTYTT